MSKLELPTLPALDTAVSTLSVTASKTERAALTKAQFHLHRGVEIMAVSGALLIPGSKGDVYRVSADGMCNCPASGYCWHLACEAIIIEAQARPTMPRLTKNREVILSEMAELF